MRRADLPYSESVLGNAADKILRGDVDEDWLAAKIESCHWCNAVGGRCWAGTPTCWHLAARLLLDMGLRPLPTPETDPSPTDSPYVDEEPDAAPPKADEVRRVSIGEARYVDSGSGWRRLIRTTNGGSVRLKTGEAAYVEERFAEAAA